MIRPFRPLPFRRDRSTPSSRAKRRTEGPAWARANPASSTGGNALAAATGSDPAGVGVCTGGEAVIGGARMAAAAGMEASPDSGVAAPGLMPAAAAAPRRRRTTASPRDTVDSSVTSTCSTMPADGDGTSIAALSVSSVINGASGSTASPTATSTSTTLTSVKSPMSGTSTVITSPAAAPVAASAGAATSPVPAASPVAAGGAAVAGPPCAPAGGAAATAAASETG
jgi:hypothetical protein